MLRGLVGETGTSVRLADLLFPQAATARMAVVALIGVALAVLRAADDGRAPRPTAGTRGAAGAGGVLRAAPRLVRRATARCSWALAGLPFFIIALADPRTAVTREEVTYPGRRISLMIDASSSMLTALPANRFAEGAPNNAAFFTTVGAARYFIERRMNGSSTAT